MYCFKVSVKTTNSMGDTTMAPEGKSPVYLKCNQGVVYVHAVSFAEVQQVIHPDWIKKIEKMGMSYTVSEHVYSAS